MTAPIVMVSIRASVLQNLILAAGLAASPKGARLHNLNRHLHAAMAALATAERPAIAASSGEGPPLPRASLTDNERPEAATCAHGSNIWAGAGGGLRAPHRGDIQLLQTALAGRNLFLTKERGHTQVGHVISGLTAALSEAGLTHQDGSPIDETHAVHFGAQLREAGIFLCVIRTPA